MPKSTMNEAEFVAAWRADPFPTINAYMQRFHTSDRYIRKVLKRNGIQYDHSSHRIEIRQQAANVRELRDVIAPKLLQTFHFYGDALITADYHAPATSMEMVDALIQVAKDEKIRQLFIGGDFFNLDVLSCYSRKIGGNDKNPPLTDELKFGGELLDLLETQFSSIVYCMGNHEARFQKVVNEALSFKVIADWLRKPRLRFVDTYHFYLDNIRVTHPKSYSQVKMSVAARLCDKYNCDVISAHGHFATAGYSRGGHRAVDLGCMADWERIEYMTQADTTHPVWNRGFVLYKNKQLRMYAKGYGV